MRRRHLVQYCSFISFPLTNQLFALVHRKSLFQSLYRIASYRLSISANLLISLRINSRLLSSIQRSASIICLKNVVISHMSPSLLLPRIRYQNRVILLTASRSGERRDGLGTAYTGSNSLWYSYHSIILGSSSNDISLTHPPKQVWLYPSA